MKLHSVKSKPRALIFDLDNTLYANMAYTAHQEYVLLQKLGETRSWTVDMTQQHINTWRDTYATKNGGRKPSLGNTFVAFGISIAMSIQWREVLIRPELFLGPDETLIRVMNSLKTEYVLGVLTNNPIKIAQKTLEILGIHSLISCIVGLDSTGVSKPDSAGFELSLKRMGVTPDQALSIGDRFEIDIEPALTLGMSGILVQKLDDIYLLPEILSQLPARV